MIIVLCSNEINIRLDKFSSCYIFLAVEKYPGYRKAQHVLRNVYQWKAVVKA